MLSVVDAMKAVIIDDIRTRHENHVLVMSYIQKVISVLLSEALSNTVYECCRAVLGEEHKLLSRTLYAVFVTLYSPFIAWFIAHSRCAKGESFLAMSLRLHGSLCPVLLAWGWKDWADQLHDEPGEHPFLRDIGIAVTLTFTVIILQSVPCFSRSRQAIAKGGTYDTLLARYATVPASLGLTAGYCWNLVSTYYLDAIEKLAKGYDFAFTVQMVHALILGAAASAVSIYVRNFDARNAPIVAKAADVEKAQDETNHHAVKHDTHWRFRPRTMTTYVTDIASNWTGSLHQTSLHCMTTIMSFQYAWAFLDTMDAFALGLMFECQSYSQCSQQVNFLIALVFTTFFVPIARVLDQCKEYGGKDHVQLNTMISLQMNALMLSNGWSWMHWYSTLMSHFVSRAPSEGVRVILYIQTFLVFLVFTSIIYFIFERLEIGWTTHYEKVISEFVKACSSSQAELKEIHEEIKKVHSRSDPHAQIGLDAILVHQTHEKENKGDKETKASI